MGRMYDEKTDRINRQKKPSFISPSGRKEAGWPYMYEDDDLVNGVRAIELKKAANFNRLATQQAQTVSKLSPDKLAKAKENLLLMSKWLYGGQ